jgi:hypothetical protein
MTPPETYLLWSPVFAAHVVGYYEPRVANDDGTFEPQRWMVRCSKCGVDYGPARCHSGIVQTRIAMFAKGHLHLGE